MPALNILKRNISGKKVLLLFILTNIIYTLMLTITIPRVVKLAGGMKLPDMMPTGYDHEYINTLLGALGETGRHAYLYQQIPLDMIYPFLFGISYCLLLAYILNKLGKLNGFFSYLCFIPLFAGFFDYLENFGIVAMLNSYPGNPPFLSQMTNVFSILKSAFTTLFFVVLIVTLIAFGGKLITRKST